VKFTYDDLLRFPDDGKRHEIIDGEHYVTPSPNTNHQRTATNLTGMLWAHLQTHPIGEVFSAPFDVVFSDFDVVQPDVLYISRERRPILTDKHVRGAPDLAVEILSPATRTIDETQKRELYERLDVREYWVVDPVLQTITIDRLVGDAFARVGTLSAERNDVLSTPLLPGFSARLTGIFTSPI
jgi:Uma2 family endonuclease